MDRLIVLGKTGPRNRMWSAKERYVFNRMSKIIRFFFGFVLLEQFLIVSKVISQFF